MILLAFALFGGMVGIGIRHYCTHFADHLIRQIYLAYCEIYPINPPHFASAQATIQPIKCGHFFYYFFAFGLFFLWCAVTFSNSLTAIIVACYGSILFVIGKIDWHYKLISPANCQLLLALGIGSAYFQIIPLSLEQSLHSAALGFICFFVVYHLAKWHYKQEAFGRGDYWLISALAAFIPWQNLPLMIFIACISAIIYAMWLKWQKKPINFIPFAPFLNLGGAFTFLTNSASINTIMTSY